MVIYIILLMITVYNFNIPVSWVILGNEGLIQEEKENRHPNSEIEFGHCPLPVSDLLLVSVRLF